MENPPIRCLINDLEVEIDPRSAPSGLTVLDYLRGHRRLVGTKEGCKEGDCGACVVLVGELTADGAVRYAPMTSCMMPVAEVHGKHVATVEGLDTGDLNRGGLNTAQREIVAEGASQCGFCTPGIVVSLMGRLLEDETPSTDDGALADAVDRALSGHLCRCTGYRSLRAAAATTFKALASSRGVRGLVDAGELPPSWLEAPGRLRRLGASPPEDGHGQAASPTSLAETSPAQTWVAGGTDLYVQRGEHLPIEQVTALGSWQRERPQMRGISRDGAGLRIGALTRFEELAESALFRSRVSGIQGFMDLVASWQIRTRSTVGGNLINASPIGDVTVLMLALGAVAVFEETAPSSAGTVRELPLEDLYLGYKSLDRQASEVLLEVRIPDLDGADGVDFEKVSKRRWLDIATVNSAARLRVRGGVIEDARLAVGGVAPVPLFLRRTSAQLAGRPASADTLALALESAQGEIAPISDVRGSAAYKRLLVRHLLAAHFTNLLPDHFDVEATYRALATA